MFIKNENGLGRADAFEKFFIINGRSVRPIVFRLHTMLRSNLVVIRWSMGYLVVKAEVKNSPLFTSVFFL